MNDAFISAIFGITTSIAVYKLLSIKKNKNAVCVFEGLGNIKFEQLEDGKSLITCNLKCSDNIKPGLHGLHVHKCGDLTSGCESTCSHYNPDGNVHGGPHGKNRHRGDLGNIQVLECGKCNDVFTASINVDEIIGRGLILHEDEDDLGHGENEESKKTGNAGRRIACGVIGLVE